MSDDRATILVGDALETLRGLPAASVQGCVTSPPYWGLRDYGTAAWEGGRPDCDHRKDTAHQAQGATSQRAGRANAEAQRNENFVGVCPLCGAVRVDRQIGLEPTVDAYVAALVAVFAEVRRVLANTGTLWLNLGDSYAREPAKGGSGTPNGRNIEAMGFTGEKPVPSGLKPKDLLMIPARVALALQADGWWLRSDIIWCLSGGGVALRQDAEGHPDRTCNGRRRQSFLRGPRRRPDRQGWRLPRQETGQSAANRHRLAHGLIYFAPSRVR